MTAQSMEKLIYNGEEVWMATVPLESYLNTLNQKHDFSLISSGCWRGYNATWEVKNDKLYLIDFLGHMKTAPDTIAEVTMDYVFPDQLIVFADWFNGEIRIPKGPLLKYIHGGYLSIYEMDLYLGFEKGVLISTRLVDNLDRLAKEQLLQKTKTTNKLIINKLRDFLQNTKN